MEFLNSLKLTKMVKRLLFDNILIKIKPEELKQLKSGLFLPATRKEQRVVGEVIAVGPGYRDCPVTTKVGDIVHVDRGIGEPWRHEDEDYLIVKENDITAIY